MRGTGKAARLGGLAMVMLCLVLAPVATAKSTRAAAPTAQASIVGGTPATIADFPSLAYVQAEEGPKKGFACTGTVIAPRVILTAGHCVEDVETGHLTRRTITGSRPGSPTSRKSSPNRSSRSRRR